MIDITIYYKNQFFINIYMVIKKSIVYIIICINYDCIYNTYVYIYVILCTFIHIFTPFYISNEVL